MLCQSQHGLAHSGWNETVSGEKAVSGQKSRVEDHSPVAQQESSSAIEYHHSASPFPHLNDCVPQAGRKAVDELDEHAKAGDET